MPQSKRRRTSGPAASKTSQQSTLSFRSTKANATLPSKDIKTAKSSTRSSLGESEAELRSDTQVVEVPTEPTVKFDEQAESEVDADEEEEDDGDEYQQIDQKARSLPETRLKAYWATKERERKAPRVHQQGLSIREKILREFDMSSRFGPCIGIQRLARWRRAHDLGMEPPIEILAVLLKEIEEDNGKRKGSAEKRDVQVSIIDDLTLSSRLRGADMIEA